MLYDEFFLYENKKKKTWFDLHLRSTDQLFSFHSENRYFNLDFLQWLVLENFLLFSDKLVDITIVCNKSIQMELREE